MNPKTHLPKEEYPATFFIYDGRCRVCSYIARRIQKVDKHSRITFQASQKKSCYPVKFALPSDECFALFKKGGTYGAESLFHAIGIASDREELLLKIYDLPLVDKVSGYSYSVFKKLRSKIGEKFHNSLGPSWCEDNPEDSIRERVATGAIPIVQTSKLHWS